MSTMSTEGREEIGIRQPDERVRGHTQVSGLRDTLELEGPPLLVHRWGQGWDPHWLSYRKVLLAEKLVTT